MNKVASNFVGSVPKFYESGLVPVLFEDYAEDLAKRVIKCKPSNVLELASGTGVVTRILRDGLASNCDLIASDLNEPMLDVAKEKFKSDKAFDMVVVDSEKPLVELVKDIQVKLKEKIVDTEVALNMASGSGKEHMALISAVLKLGVGIRMVAPSEKGIKEL